MTRNMRGSRRDRRIARLSIHIFATTIRLGLAAFVAVLGTCADGAQCEVQFPLELLLRMERLCRTVEFFAVGS